jgi:hypothetical protein
MWAYKVSEKLRKFRCKFVILRVNEKKDVFWLYESPHDIIRSQSVVPLPVSGVSNFARLLSSLSLRLSPTCTSLAEEGIRKLMTAERCDNGENPATQEAFTPWLGLGSKLWWAAACTDLCAWVRSLWIHALRHVTCISVFGTDDTVAHGDAVNKRRWDASCLRHLCGRQMADIDRIKLLF